MYACLDFINFILQLVLSFFIVWSWQINKLINNEFDMNYQVRIILVINQL